MKEIELSYAELMTIVAGNKQLELQHVERDDRYFLFAIENGVSWQTTLLKGSTDSDDFEANYKADTNKPGKGLVKLDTAYYGGKPSIRAESRPDNTVTYFTNRGDSATDIGDGNIFEWDFSNTDNDITAPTNFKRKQINITFADPVYVKEGTIYFHNAPKGAYADFFVVCPDGGVYLDRSGNPQVASGDTVISHYVNHLNIQGSVPMGDELNTETANIDPIPAGYIFRLEITTPDTDSTSNGYSNLEIYRERTNLLPGESI